MSECAQLEVEDNRAVGRQHRTKGSVVEGPLPYYEYANDVKQKNKIYS